MTTHGGRDGDRPREPGVGTVAGEAARLVELLADRAATAGSGGGPSRGEDRGRSASADTSADAEARGACACDPQRPTACAVCPVCQLIAFVQRVSPDSIDRLADVVELAATGLRDLAVLQRARRREQPGRESAAPPDQPAPASDPSRGPTPDSPDGPAGEGQA